MTNQLNLVIVATLAIAVTSSFAQSWLEPTFYLYTRANRGNNAPETLKYQSSSSIEASHFNGAVPTKVITHGYFDSSSRGKWMEEMAGRMLDAEDVNVIIVDWSNANRGLYPVAVANAKLVGAMVGREIELLGQTTNASVGSFHLLGHSLGGHLVSFAGKHLKGALGRITGLDPAGPSFQGRPSWDRLWPTDAQFVDVIHTDGNRLGMWETTGHLDFYPNGGVATQPGCNEERTSELRKSFACSHMRAYEFYLDAIGSETNPEAKACGSFSAFKSGSCSSSSSGGGSETAILGPKAIEYKEKVKGVNSPTGKRFFLQSKEHRPLW